MSKTQFAHFTGLIRLKSLNHMCNMHYSAHFHNCGDGGNKNNKSSNRKPKHHNIPYLPTYTVTIPTSKSPILGKIPIKNVFSFAWTCTATAYLSNNESGNICIIHSGKYNKQFIVMRTLNFKYSNDTLPFELFIAEIQRTSELSLNIYPPHFTLHLLWLRQLQNSLWNKTI